MQSALSRRPSAVRLLLSLLCTTAVAAGLSTVAIRAQAPPAPAAATPRAAAPAPAGNAQKGQELFTTYYCYSCHGSDGQGGAGAKIAPNPPAYTTLRNYVRKPTGGMPPYISKSLPDADLADIYAYLKTIPAEQPAKNIPLLNQ
jgi:mono/diheme cytochrome c family protein